MNTEKLVGILADHIVVLTNRLAALERRVLAIEDQTTVGHWPIPQEWPVPIPRSSLDHPDTRRERGLKDGYYEGPLDLFGEIT